MARTKPQGKKKMGTSKVKAPAKQGQDNWRSSCQVLAAAAAAAAAAPVAAPTTDAVILPAGSSGTVAAFGISAPSATAAATTVIVAAPSSTATANHSAAAAAPPSKKGASKARAPVEGTATASGVGTLEGGYAHNVPLPRVPRSQSASLMTSKT